MELKKRSAVWRYFTPVNENTANCDVCKKVIRYCGNTTNLYKHLKRHEKESLELQSEREEPNSDRAPPAVRQKSLAESFQPQKYPGS